jgi:hypothetical protein
MPMGVWLVLLPPQPIGSAAENIRDHSANASGGSREQLRPNLFPVWREVFEIGDHSRNFVIFLQASKGHFCAGYDFAWSPEISHQGRLVPRQSGLLGSRRVVVLRILTGWPPHDAV